MSMQQENVSEKERAQPIIYINSTLSDNPSSVQQKSLHSAQSVAATERANAKFQYEQREDSLQSA